METFARICNVMALTLAGINDRIEITGFAFAGFMATYALAAAVVGWRLYSKRLVASSVAAIGGTALLMIIMVAAQGIGEAFMRTAVSLGLTAGGSGQGADAFLSQPDLWVQKGWAQAATVAEIGDAVCGMMNWKCAAASWIPWFYWLVSWFVLLVYAIGAAVMVVVMFVYKLVLALAIVLTPLALLGFTRAFGLAPLRYCVYALCNMFVMASVLTLSNNIMTATAVEAAAATGTDSIIAAVGPLAGAILSLVLYGFGTAGAQYMAGHGVAALGSAAGLAAVTLASAGASITGGVRGAITGARVGSVVPIVGGAAGSVLGGVAGATRGAISGRAAQIVVPSRSPAGPVSISYTAPGVQVPQQRQPSSYNTPRHTASIGGYGSRSP